MSEEVIEEISKITKQLYTLNLVSVLICFIMWIISLCYAITMGLKYGLTFQMTTIIEGIEKTTTSNTIFNLAMSGVFTWILITALLSFFYLFAMYNSHEVEKR